MMGGWWKDRPDIIYDTQPQGLLPLRFFYKPITPIGR